MKRLVVELHDVAPPFEREIRDQLEALQSIGVNRCVLQVVPNWHGVYPMTAAQSLIDLLQCQQAAGSQLVLHGCEHRPHGSFRGSAWKRVRGRVFARDAAEFLTLPPAEAERAVVRGLNLLEQAGLPRPTAFCAPGWLLADDAYPAIARAGIHSAIEMVSAHDLWSGRRIWTPAIGYIGAGRGQELGIRILNAMVRSATGGRASTIKVYLHPQGERNNSAQRRILAEAARLGEAGWRPSTYADVWGAT